MECEIENRSRASPDRGFESRPLRCPHLNALTPPTMNTLRIAVAFLLNMSINLWGSTISNGVAQEKTSRTAEVLLSAVRPSQLLAGKVALLSDEVIPTVSVSALIRFQLASTALTVTLKAVPAV